MLAPLISLNDFRTNTLIGEDFLKDGVFPAPIDDVRLVCPAGKGRNAGLDLRSCRRRYFP